MSTSVEAAARGKAVRVLAALVVAALLAAAFASWADEQGYISITGESCSAEGYQPSPTYKELRSKYGQSPFCARLYLDETW